jgi:hypothetical protein
MNRSIEEIDAIHHGDTRYKDLNPLIINTVKLREGRRTLVALHASSMTEMREEGEEIHQEEEEEGLSEVGRSRRVDEGKAGHLLTENTSVMLPHRMKWVACRSTVSRRPLILQAPISLHICQMRRTK